MLDCVRLERDGVLDLDLTTARGRYEAGFQGGLPVRGYLEEDGVAADSRTETFAALRLEIANRRWAGVPFYLRAGKRLTRRVTEVAVVFKQPPFLPFESAATTAVGANTIVLRIQPDEGITLRLASKVPGTQMELRDVSMDFGYGATFNEESPEAYERLILDALLGDAPLFPPPARGRPVLAHSRSRHRALERRWESRGLSPRLLGAGQCPRSPCPRRPHLEALMITTLTATTTSRIVSRLVEHEGTSGSSRVLTLVISTDEGGLESALCAAHGASRDHPSRIIAVVKPPEEDTTGRETPRSRDGHVSAQAGGHLDAEIRVGHDAGAGETLVLRPWDEAALHTDTLVVPFLLPDAPVSCGGRRLFPRFPRRTPWVAWAPRASPTLPHRSSRPGRCGSWHR